MKELMEYREKLVKRLNEAADDFCRECRSVSDPSSAVGGWSAHQAAFHARDVDREVYGLRIRRTVQEDNPLFENFDPDGWMAAHYNRDELLESILLEFSKGIRETCAMLVELPQEGWSRTSRHASLGGDLTLQLWVERSLAHLEEHLAALKTA